MGRRRFRLDATDLVLLDTEPASERDGLIRVVAISNGLASAALDVVVVASYVRAARRAMSARQDGARAMAQAVLTRPVITLTCVRVAHQLGTKMVMVRWLERTLRRIKGGA